MTHAEPHPQAGKKLVIVSGTFKGEEIVVEDWTDRLWGYHWYQGSIENPSIMEATTRSIRGEFPMTPDAFYGKIGGFGHIVHMQEVEEKKSQ